VVIARLKFDVAAYPLTETNTDVAPAGAVSSQVSSVPPA
jgi:hypothetical protein